MITVRYTTLGGKMREFKFHDENVANAFIVGLESLRELAQIVLIEKI